LNEIAESLRKSAEKDEKGPKRKMSRNEIKSECDSDYQNESEKDDESQQSQINVDSVANSNLLNENMTFQQFQIDFSNFPTIHSISFDSQINSSIMSNTFLPNSNLDFPNESFNSLTPRSHSNQSSNVPSITPVNNNNQNSTPIPRTSSFFTFSPFSNLT